MLRGPDNGPAPGPARRHAPGAHMAATIGGRIEAVAPRRSLFGPDYLRLAALAAVSLAVHLWLVGHTAVTARDGLGFARYALALQSPHAASVPNDPGRTAVEVIR